MGTEFQAFYSVDHASGLLVSCLLLPLNASIPSDGLLPGAAVALYEKMLDADAMPTAPIKLIRINATFFISFRFG